MAGSRVTVLGTGIMGAPMARNIAASGCAVTVWNRTLEKARDLDGDGVTVAADPVSAVEGASHVVTMLTDAAAVADVMFDQGVADALGVEALWLQMSTVGMQATDHLAKLASDRGLLFVDAPVLGTRQPAEKGELVILASAREEVREHCEVVFRAVGKKTLWLEEGGKASRLKLVANAWIVALLAGLAESDHLGLPARAGSP